MLPNVGLIGSAGAGKGVLADLLIAKAGYSRVSLAGGVKVDVGRMLLGAEADEMENPEVIEWVNEHKAACRGLLQAYGVAKRELVAEDHWINQCLELVESENNGFGIPCVTDDVRFPNEVIALREAGFFIVKIDRPDDHRQEHGSPILTPEQKAHSSEAQIDDLPADFVIRNNGTPELLLARFLAALGLHFMNVGGNGVSTQRGSMIAGVFPCASRGD